MNYGNVYIECAEWENKGKVTQFFESISYCERMSVTASFIHLYRVPMSYNCRTLNRSVCGQITTKLGENLLWDIIVVSQCSCTPSEFHHRYLIGILCANHIGFAAASLPTALKCRTETVIDHSKSFCFQNFK